MNDPSNDHHNGDQPIPSLPALQSLDAAILVPLPGGSDGNAFVEEPFEAPPNRTARLQAILASLESHHGVVRENIVSLVRQECARIILDAKAREEREKMKKRKRTKVATTAAAVAAAAAAGATGQLPRRPTVEDLDKMIANMRSKGSEKEEQQEDVESKLTEIVVQAPPDGTAREDCTRDVMITLDRGIEHLSAFENHVVKTREYYKGALEREKVRDAE